RRDGSTGVQGMAVNLIGPPTFSAPTDQNGCAYFGNIQGATPYTINASLVGYTTPSWTASINDGPFTPPAGSVAIKQYLYDRAASVNVRVDTKLANGTTPAETAEFVTFQHPSIPGTGIVQLGSTGVQASTFSSSLAFPFTSPYSVYAGKCVGANPALYNSTNPTQQFQLDPGNPYNLTVRKPALNVKVVDLSNNPLSGANVRVTPNTSALTGGDPSMTGCSSYTFTTNAQGLIDDPSVPYGRWLVCANTTGATPKKTLLPTAVLNGDPNGVNPVQNVVLSGLFSGTCP
ncbi:MAG: hypothetical protein ACJ77M_09305, partial [Thermoleophilaceae bacterium]